MYDWTWTNSVTWNGALHVSLEVDDVITAIKVDHVNTVLNRRNSLRQNIKFTYELEKDDQISFLDGLLIGKANCIADTINWKPATNYFLLTLEVVCAQEMVF